MSTLTGYQWGWTVRTTKCVFFISACTVALLALGGCPTAELRRSVEDVVSRGTIPGRPSNLVAAAASSVSIVLTWTDGFTNETGFAIERSRYEAEGFEAIDAVATDVTSWTDQGLLPSTTYYYRVSAANAAGVSAHTPVVWATTVMAAPSELSIAVV